MAISKRFIGASWKIMEQLLEVDEEIIDAEEFDLYAEPCSSK